jgi:hypothetical protein
MAQEPHSGAAPERGSGMKRMRLIGIISLGVLITTLFGFTATRTARAGVADTTGNILFVSPPPDVVLTTFEDNTNVRLFREQIGLVLPKAITLDVTMPGKVDAFSDLTRASLAQGTNVDSYLLHADPLSFGRPIRVFEGSVTFDQPILGMMITFEALTASDTLLGSATTNYIPPETFRGFEGPGFPESNPIVGDSLELSADFLTLKFSFRTESRMDQIRVVTAPNPEPSTAVLVTIVAAFAAFRR